METPEVTKTEKGFKIKCGQVEINLFKDTNHIFVIGATSNQKSNEGSLCSASLSVTEGWTL